MGFGDLLKKASQKANELVKTGAEVLEDVKQSAVRGIESASEVIKERVEIHEAEAEERRKQREAAEAEKKEKQEHIKRLTGTLKGHIRLETEKERKKAAEEAKRQQAIEEAVEIEKQNKEAEEEAQQKDEKTEQLLVPSCEKGDCLWNHGKFYYTCDECTECIRKNTTKNMHGKIKYPQLWKYMKRYEEREQIDKQITDAVNELGEDYYGVTLDDYNTDDFEKRARYNELSDFRAHISVQRTDGTITSDLLSEFMPMFVGNSYIEFAIDCCGIDAPFFDMLWDLKDMGLELSDKKLKTITGGYNGFSIEISSNDKYHPLEHERDFYRNPSLYDRSDKDFIYTLKALLSTVSDNPEIYAKLFDCNGDILPAGIGGPERGFYDACIWNVIHNNL